MDTLIKADVFFFVTTVALVLLAAVFLVALVYLIKILRDIRHIAGVIRREADEIAADFKNLRERVKSEGFASFGAARALGAMFRKRKNRKGR